MASDITAGTLAGKNTKVHESLVDGIDSYEDTTPRKVISKKKIFGFVLCVACSWKVTSTLNVCRRVVLLTPSSCTEKDPRRQQT